MRKQEVIFSQTLRDESLKGKYFMQLAVPVVGILRGIDAVFFGELMQASFAAGLEALEITMNTADAPRIVTANRPAVPAGRLLGMGTIRNLEEARAAADAGAMFFVTPNLDPAVIAFARERTIPVIAGAFTPTEVYAAWAAGADMVKVFPCRPGGPEYIRDLRGPFDRIPLMAVGGVDIFNVRDYFEAGASAVGCGDSMFGRRALAQRNIEELAANVRLFIGKCPRMRATRREKKDV